MPNIHRKAGKAAPERRHWMAVLAKAGPDELARHAKALAPLPEVETIRPPETGSVMVRGRASGVGAPFNMGEMTVTRCTVRLDTGETGHAYVAGRSKAHARMAAILDAMLQTVDHGVRVRRTVVEPLDALHAERRRARAAKVAATKVDFFTMVRGEG